MTGIAKSLCGLSQAGGAPPGGVPTIIQVAALVHNGTLPNPTTAGSSMLLLWANQDPDGLLQSAQVAGVTMTNIEGGTQAGELLALDMWIGHNMPAGRTDTNLVADPGVNVNAVWAHWYEVTAAQIVPGETNFMYQDLSGSTQQYFVDPPGQSNAESLGIGCGVVVTGPILNMDTPGWTGSATPGWNQAFYKPFPTGMVGERGAYTVSGFRQSVNGMVPLVGV